MVKYQFVQGHISFLISTVGMKRSDWSIPPGGLPHCIRSQSVTMELILRVFSPNVFSMNGL